MLRLTLRNRRRMRELVEAEAIDCDFCPAGWLFLAHDERLERGLLEEAALIEAHGARVELWSPERVRAELGFVTRFRSRFLPEDGSYHPYRYACGLLDRALRRGVELYTRLPVLELVVGSVGPPRGDDSGGPASSPGASSWRRTPSRASCSRSFRSSRSRAR